jgi:palmitoyl-protein thioesterase
MLVMFTEDSVVYPNQSEWFQTMAVDENGDYYLQTLEESEWYQDDAIGLRSLNEAGKVQFISIDGDHLQFSQSDIDNTFVPFLMQ